MDNNDRIKALNILFTATWISIIISIIINFACEIMNAAYTGRIIMVLSPIVTYIVGRILCFKEYKDETP